MGIAAQGAGGRHVGHHQADRPVALGLQRKDAVIFERPRQHDGKGDRLAQHRRHRLGVGVLRQDAVDRRTKPDEPAAQREGIDPEGLDKVVQPGVRREAQTQMLR